MIMLAFLALLLSFVIKIVIFVELVKEVMAFHLSFRVGLPYCL